MTAFYTRHTSLGRLNGLNSCHIVSKVPNRLIKTKGGFHLFCSRNDKTHWIYLISFKSSLLPTLEMIRSRPLLHLSAQAHTKNTTDRGQSIIKHKHKLSSKGLNQTVCLCYDWHDVDTCITMEIRKRTIYWRNHREETQVEMTELRWGNFCAYNTFSFSRVSCPVYAIERPNILFGALLD